MTETASNNRPTLYDTAREAGEFFLHIKEPNKNFSEQKKKIEDLLSLYDQGLIGSARFYLLHDELVDRVRTKKVPLPEAGFWAKWTKDDSMHTQEIEQIQFHAPGNYDTSWGVLMCFNPKLKGNPLISNPTYFVRISNENVPRLKSEWISNGFLHPSYRVSQGDSYVIRYHTDQLNPGIYSKTTIWTTNEGKINGIDMLEIDAMAGSGIHQEIKIARDAAGETFSRLNSSRTLDILQQILSPLPFERMEM